jgi:ATP-dependent RNA helicase DeaD
LTNPQQITAKSKTLTAATIIQRVCLVESREKLDVLVRIFESEPTEGVLVFVKTREATTRLAEQLCQQGYSASSLNGDMPQRQRENTVDQLKSGRLNIVVATDVAARGLDVQRISHVINYDFPHDTEAYIHRIGRTGRAGREGIAILFIGKRDKFRLRRIEQVTKQQITWMDRPSIKAVQEQRVARFRQSVVETIEGGDLEFFENLLEEFHAESGLPLETLSAALLKMAQPNLQPPKEKPRREQDGRKNRKERGFGEDFASTYESSSDSRDRPNRDRKGRRGTAEHMEKYRIEVGHAHGVRPGNIVGAIANEAGLEGDQIGGIEISTHFSSVDLPRGLPSDLIQRLQQVRVVGQLLRIAPWARENNFRAASGKPNFRNSSKPKAKFKAAGKKNGKSIRKPDGKKKKSKKTSKAAN